MPRRQRTATLVDGHADSRRMSFSHRYPELIRAAPPVATIYPPSAGPHPCRSRDPEWSSPGTVRSVGGIPALRRRLRSMASRRRVKRWAMLSPCSVCCMSSDASGALRHLPPPPPPPRGRPMRRVDRGRGGWPSGRLRIPVPAGSPGRPNG